MTRTNQSTQALALAAAAGLAALSVQALAEVPTYRVEVIETFTTTTTVRGAGQNGRVVGDQVLGGFVKPFVATLSGGIQTLPLPAGYNSGTALDVNASGEIVGAVDDAGLPFDAGEPAIWTPDGAGGYSVMIPDQLQQLDSPLGPLGVNGGMAVAINDSGTVVGWSRFQGFQGGPTTRFFKIGAPVNLGDAGFSGTVRDLNNNGIAVGDQIMFDLNTMTATDIGVPDPLQPGNVSFTNSIGFAINDSNEVVVAANLASVPTENYLTYTFTQTGGFDRLNPAQLPSRFVGFYDNNNLGDVSASGGVYFASEDTLVPSYNSLLDPADADWNTSIGFIDDARRVLTTGVNAATGENAIVMLVPDAGGCPADLSGDGVASFPDVGIFLGLFATSDPAADFNGDGAVSFPDVGAFIAAFASGCP